MALELRVTVVCRDVLEMMEPVERMEQMEPPECPEPRESPVTQAETPMVWTVPRESLADLE